MIRLVLAEIKKLKQSSMLWIGMGGCFLLPLMALGINLSTPDKFTWLEYVTQNLWPQIILLWPCIIGVFGSYIFNRERIENTYKNLLIIPVGRIRLTISKLIVLLGNIVVMCTFTYVLNLSGILVGVSVDMQQFIEGLRVYVLSGMLLFIAMLPIILISILSRRGYILSISVTIIYALASFLASWVSIPASLLPIDVVWRIIGLNQFNIKYAFPLKISYGSLAVIGICSLFGILTASKLQEA